MRLYRDYDNEQLLNIEDLVDEHRRLQLESDVMEYIEDITSKNGSVEIVSIKDLVEEFAETEDLDELTDIEVYDKFKDYFCGISSPRAFYLLLKNADLKTTMEIIANM